MKHLKQLAKSFRRDEEGATAIEYALLAALISVAAIATMTAVGNQVFDTFNEVNTSLGGDAVARPE